MNLEDQIIEIISNTLGVEKDSILPESDFYNDFNADKLEVTDLILKIAQEFKLELNNDDFNKVNTMADLIKLIELNIDEI